MGSLLFSQTPENSKIQDPDNLNEPAQPPSEDESDEPDDGLPATKRIPETLEPPDLGNQTPNSSPQKKPISGDANLPTGDAAAKAIVSKVKDLEDPLVSKVSEVGDQLFYDARIIGFDRKNNTSIFEGEVVIIGAGTIFSADLITVNQNENTLNASGHVIVVTGSNVFTGTELKYFWETGDMRIMDAILVSHDGAISAEVTSRVLGFSPEEQYFETQRKQRLEYLSKSKSEILLDYADKAVFGVDPPDKFVDPYATLLEQEDVVRKIPNAALAKLSEKRRESYIKRRKFWEQHESDTLKPKVGMPSYFRIEGAEIQRTHGNDFHARESEWTPCYCDQDSHPTWSFRAETIDAQTGGYVDLTHAVLEIKGMPVLYLPRLKIPLKGTRQSGFLFPTLRTGDQKHGTVYTQPVFFDFAKNLDSTLTTDFFQERGTRLGLETRYQYRRYSGFTLKLDTIRDKVWIDERHTRERLLEWYHSDAGPACRDKADPAEKQSCLEHAVDRPLKVPGNTWRGSEEWEGTFFLTPRTSISTRGLVRSDHRYVEDLFLTDQIEQAFHPNLFANSYNTIRGRLSYDGFDAYAGVSAYYGDNVLIPTESFTGLQIPGRVDLATRFVDLDPLKILPVPFYGNAEYTFIPIQERGADIHLVNGDTSLGSGQWQRAALNLASPLKSDGIITVDYFGDAEVRKIKHSGPGTETNEIFSRTSGVSFKLPMDGIGVLPDFFQSHDKDDPNPGERYFQHIMKWEARLSSRPVVVRRGDYGDFGDHWSDTKPSSGAPLVYFAGDRTRYYEDDDAVSLENAMQTHQMITFETGHSWKTYRKSWTTNTGIPKPEEGRRKKRPETYRERAIKELTYSQDRLVGGYRDMFTENFPAPPPRKLTEDEKVLDQAKDEPPEPPEPPPEPMLGPTGVNWHINRYRLVNTDVREPFGFSSKISYDFEQEKRRQKQVNLNREIEARDGEDGQGIVPYSQLPRSWIGPITGLGFGWGAYSLGIIIDYDMYVRTSRELTLNFGLPPIFGASVGASYRMSKAVSDNRELGILEFRRTRYTDLYFSTDVIPKVMTKAKYQKKSVEGEPNDTYETVVGFTYLDNSGCWGVELLRQKLHNQLEPDASYIINLQIIFMGQSRGQNVSSGIVNKIKGG